MKKFTSSGGSLIYTLTRKKIKNIRIRVTGASEVVVSAPYHSPENRIRQFVADNSIKIYDNLEKIDNKRLIFYPVEYSNGEDFWYLGKKTLLKVIESGHARAVYTGEELVLKVPDGCGFKQRRAIFTLWAKRQAFLVFEERAAKITPYFSSLIRQDMHICVRNMLSRWGSINPSRHSISLSVHLLRCEIELIDYIITHELCHLKFSNHSKAFYRELEKYFPDRKKLDKRLNEYGLVDFW